MKNYTKDSNITIEKIKDKLHLFCKGKNMLIPNILEQRLNNVTLRNIGIGIGVTQERIRQMEAKGVEMLRHDFVLPVEKEHKRYTELIETLPFSNRMINTLTIAGGLRTLGGILRKSEYDLFCIDGIGKKMVNEIKLYLSSIGLSLRK